MARKFIGRKEIAFMNAINKELIQAVVGQEVFYYEILAEKTKKNDLYNEAIVKMWAPPVRCNALVYYENTQEQVGALPPDSKYPLDVYFHKAELDERRLSPKMGDFVQFGPLLYEIYSASEPQMAFGQVENKVMVKCTCGPARQGQFAPPKQPMPSNGPDANAPRYNEEPPSRAYTADPRRKP